MTFLSVNCNPYISTLFLIKDLENFPVTVKRVSITNVLLKDDVHLLIFHYSNRQSLKKMWKTRKWGKDHMARFPCVVFPAVSSGIISNLQKSWKCKHCLTPFIRIHQFAFILPCWCHHYLYIDTHLHVDLVLNCLRVLGDCARRP